MMALRQMSQQSKPTEFNRLKALAELNGWGVPTSGQWSYIEWLKYWKAKENGKNLQAPVLT